MSITDALLIGFSLLLTAQSAYSLALTLYAWEDDEKYQRSRAPTIFAPARRSFTILLPARHEEAVIQETIQHVVDLDYPRDLVQVLVVIEESDTGTINKVTEKLADLRASGIESVRLITFNEPPINKPHGLNIGLDESTEEVVGIFDAEDVPHPDILNIVNTVMEHDNVQVVQCGVQLMNFADRWFSALNVLEYFFWFKSRLHYHAAMGMIPLGGNTVFAERVLLRRLGGWDEQCLTEDADLGIRLSAARVPMRVIYEDDYVTREETPANVPQFVRQRTRWNQGFLQILAKKDWLQLPSTRQKLLALYTLAFPLFQALLMLYLPLSILAMLYLKTGVVVALVSILPFYMAVFHFGISALGLYEFARVHRLATSWKSALWMALSYFPYQWILSYAALRAVWRQLNGINVWEKTAHVGAHRTTELSRAQDAS